MKRILIVMCLAFTACALQEPDCITDEREARTDSQDILPGQAIVLLSEESVGTLEGLGLAAVSASLGICSVERVFPDVGEFEARHRAAGLHRWYRIRYNESIPATKASAELEELPGVEAVDLPRRKAPCSYFNDRYFYNQWYLVNDGTLGRNFKKGVDINVQPVWEQFTAGSKEVIVAVLDSGIDLYHEDLTGVVLPGGINGSQNFIDGYNSSDIVPGEHGTHVGGTIGAISNNNVGVAGIAGGSNGKGGISLMSCVILGEDEEKNAGGDEAAALVWAADHGAVIANNSWSYRYDSEEDAERGADAFLQKPSPIKSAIDYFIDNAGMNEDGIQTGPMKGGVVCFSAGNQGWRHSVPGEYERVIAVGAIGPDGKMTEYSNYGPWIDILAPGGANADDKTELIYNLYPDNQYIYMAGTSMACPQVAGVAALLVSYFGGPGFTNNDLINKILGGANQNKFITPDDRTIGGGLLDAYGAFTFDTGTDNNNDLDKISVTTDYSGNYSLLSHETLAVDFKVNGNENLGFHVHFQSNCTAAVATCTSTRIHLQINALDAKPGTYSASISVGGQIKKQFDITIQSNHTPRQLAQIENQVLNEASTTPLNIDLSSFFTDPDGETLNYSVEFSSPSVAIGRISGSQLILSPNNFGLTTVSVTATDARMTTCKASFTLIVRDTSQAFDIFPIPVSNYLYVRPAEECELTVTLYNRAGASVYHTTERASLFYPLLLDVHNLAPGTYTLQIDFGGKKIIKNITKN